MTLATALTRPFAQLREWLFPEHTLAAREMIRLLDTRPGDFEIITYPRMRGVVFIQQRSTVEANPMSSTRIRLEPQCAYLDVGGQAHELHRRDRAALIQGVQSWLATYN